MRRWKPTPYDARASWIKKKASTISVPLLTTKLLMLVSIAILFGVYKLARGAGGADTQVGTSPSVHELARLTFAGLTAGIGGVFSARKSSIQAVPWATGFAPRLPAPTTSHPFHCKPPLPPQATPSTASRPFLCKPPLPPPLMEEMWNRRMKGRHGLSGLYLSPHVREMRFNAMQYESCAVPEIWVPAVMAAAVCQGA